MVEEENSAHSIERMAEIAKQIHNTIQHMIKTENILIITQDSKNKNERMLCMNINVGMENIDLKGQ